MRLTVRTSLALRTLQACAGNPGQLLRKSEVARRINASENHLAQVIHRLGQMGFLTTQRGRKGGFQLARPAGEISIGALFRALESEVPLVECLGAENTCPLTPACRMRGHLLRASEAFYGALDPLSLAELTEDNHALSALLAIGPQSRAEINIRDEACRPGSRYAKTAADRPSPRARRAARPH